MISFQIVLMNPNSEVKYHNRKTLWSSKLTSDTYPGSTDEMERTLESNSETLLPHDEGVLDKSFYLLGIRVPHLETGDYNFASSLHRKLETIKGKTQVNTVVCKPQVTIHILYY